MSAQNTVRRTPLMVVPLLLLIGLGAAAYLLQVKLSVENEVGYESACNFGSNFNCDKVQESEHSNLLGLPLALWAIPAYMLMLLLTWFGLRSSETNSAPETDETAIASTDLLVLLSSGSMVFSLYLAYIQHIEIGAFCLFCVIMYGAQFGTLICASLATPRSYVDSLKAGWATGLTSNAPVPHAAAVFAIVLALSIGVLEREKELAYHDGARNALARVTAALEGGEPEKAISMLTKLTSTRDPLYRSRAEELKMRAIELQLELDDALLAAELAAVPVPAPPVTTIPAPPVVASPTTSAPTPTQAAPTNAAPTPSPVAPQPPTVAPTRRTPSPTAGVPRGRRTDLGWSYFETPITDDDFVVGPENAPVTIVEFADFECGFCRMLSQNIHRVLDAHPNDVRLVFKFYPMDGQCNRRMGGERMHPQACDAAKAAYCAGKQGKFREAHDKLFATQNNNTPPQLKGYMTELGLDIAAWETCFNSQAPLNRITNDVRIAARAGIHGTPRMYINNRLVSGASSVSILEYYIQKALENPQMPASAPQAVAPTQDMAPMVAVQTQSGSAFIDRFEAAIDQQGRAVSLGGAQPAQTSWDEAKAACEKAGKRMCTEEEWASACTGKPVVDNNNNGWFNDDAIEGTRYPYGPFYESGACHDGQKTLEGATIPTGSMHSCRSASGVYDLTGNIGEWIESDESRASLVGGNFGGGEGAACNRRGTSFGPGIRNNTTGFRCCADSLVNNATQSLDQLRAAEADVVGSVVPSFEISDTNGAAVRSDTFRGVVTYLTFFASWCGSCKRELPELKTWQTELGPRGFRVIAVGVDRSGQRSEDFAKQYEPNYTIALDPDSRTMTHFDISAMPTSFIIDKDGKIRQRIVGFQQDEVPGIRATIEQLL